MENLNKNRKAHSNLKLFFLIRTTLLAAIAILIFEKPSLASEGDQIKKTDKRAKYRLYPGGKDEEDLKVQPQLPGPGKRIYIETRSTQESD